PHLHLHSFPTRRSSDLPLLEPAEELVLSSVFCALSMVRLRPASMVMSPSATTVAPVSVVSRPLTTCRLPADTWVPTAVLVMEARSEEHTSELQSRENLV